MKTKYYYNGELVRTSTKDYYNFACLKTNQFARTKEELMKRLHTQAYEIYNNHVKFRDWFKQYLKMNDIEFDEYLIKDKESAENNYQTYLSSIVEVTKG